jgi:hypothetical protein
MRGRHYLQRHVLFLETGIILIEKNSPPAVCRDEDLLHMPGRESFFIHILIPPSADSAAGSR